VLASSNNGAVENVTLEIPSGEAIDPAWREQAQGVDYFPALAERAMSAARGTGADTTLQTDEAAWGLVAARLGNSRNRKDFVNAVWWTEHQPVPDDRPPPPMGLRNLLKAWKARPDGVSWGQAVAAFERARDRAAAIRDERLGTHAVLDHHAELESELEPAREAERATGERVEASRRRREALEGALLAHEDERERRVQAREEVRLRRPWVLRLWARAEWRAHDRRLAADVAAVDAQLRETREELDPLEEEVRAHTEASAAVKTLEQALGECDEALSHYREQAGAKLSDGEWLGDREERERQAPWSDDEWNHARTELFLAALSLHRAFLVHAAGPMRESLDGAMDILSGRAPSDLPADAALAAWQALFLLVPVVSTTFASVSRMFEPLEAEALGWLLVDEAGQATPQNAVGALWRCRRAVVVGDPLQLEPITTIPFKVEQAIRTHHGVDEEWLTGRESVQSLADRLNRLGTTLGGVERPVWVGTPLSVHRRCDEPMFGLSNAIAYDGLMIDATDPALAQSLREPLSHPPGEQMDRRSLGHLTGPLDSRRGDRGRSDPHPPRRNRVRPHTGDGDRPLSGCRAPAGRTRLATPRAESGNDPHRSRQGGRHRDPGARLRPRSRRRSGLGGQQTQPAQRRDQPRQAPAVRDRRSRCVDAPPLFRRASRRSVARSTPRLTRR